MQYTADELKEILSLHSDWHNGKRGGVRANLRMADLSGADLSGANLSGANLDYSCWPLWCGSKGVKVDARIAAQLAAHFCAIECTDGAYLAARKAVLEFAKTSHRAVGLDIR